MDALLSYGILLNLASVCNAAAKETLWGFISRYVPEATPQTAPFLDRLVGCAINYYRDFVKPKKRYRAPDATERAALEELLHALDVAPEDASAEDLQNEVYEIGKRHPFPDLAWFQALYETLGQDQARGWVPSSPSTAARKPPTSSAKVLQGEDLSAA